MVIKKFQAKTEEEAILLAKNELGKNATVMNIKTVKPKGIQKVFKKASVEVTAAIDEEKDYSNGEEMLLKMQEIQRNIQEAQRMDNEKQQENILVDENTMTIENKLDSLQQMLEKQMQIEEKEDKLEKKEEPIEKNTVKSKSEACIHLVREQLVNNEVEDRYADSILDEIKNTIRKDTEIDQILATIYQKIVLKLGKTNLIENNSEETNYIFFVGPTGVGKTTTIAKIASDLKLRKKAKIALITSDTYRIAAVEQLRTYANILGVPLKVVYSEEEMKNAKDEFAEYDIVLIDTAGRSHKNIEQTEDMERLLNAIPKERRKIYLVLSATTKYKDLVKITETYSKIAKYNLIFTKLDETCCIGNILNIKMLTGAALSYSTSGQMVPDDIEAINPQKIAKQLLGGQ